MKLISSNTFKGSNTEGQALQILAGASAFDALSSGIYSDKIRAFIRELCCNAYDAWTQRCRDVGIENASPIPFEIKLPNVVDPEFYVRDFGTGMDHDYWVNELLADPDNPGMFKETPVLKDYVATHHATYFLTNKAEDDGLIGGFGVGSKSPMTYTDLYVVENRKNGRKTVHHIYKEDARPKITKKLDTATTEPDGMTISFAIAEKDFPEVSLKAAHVLQHFPIKPRVLGGVLPKVELLALRLSESLELLPNHNAAILVMGQVEYPLAGFEAYAPKGFAEALYDSQFGFRLTVPVGTAWPTLSRESLDMHDRTKQGLSRAFSKAEAEVEAAIQAVYDAKETEYGKMQALSTFATLFYSGQFLDKVSKSLNPDLLAKFKASRRGIELPHGELPFGISVCYSDKSMRTVVNGYFQAGREPIRARIVGHTYSPACIWIADVSRFRDRLVQHYLKTGVNPNANSYVVKADLANPVHVQALNDWLALVGNPPVRKVSELSVSAAVRRVAVDAHAPVTKVTVNCTRLSITVSAKKGIEVTQPSKQPIDFETGVPYLVYVNGRWKSPLDPIAHYNRWGSSAFKTVIGLAQGLGLPNSTWDTVYVIPAAMEKKFLALGCWPLEKPILDALADPIQRDALAEKVNHAAAVCGSVNVGNSLALSQIAESFFNPSHAAQRQVRRWLTVLADTKVLGFFKAVDRLQKKGRLHSELIDAIQSAMIGTSNPVFKPLDWSFLSDMWTNHRVSGVLQNAYPLLETLNLENKHQLDYLRWCETQPHFKLPEIISQIGKPLHLVPALTVSPAKQDETPVALSRVA